MREGMPVTHRDETSRRIAFGEFFFKRRGLCLGILKDRRTAAEFCVDSGGTFSRRLAIKRAASQREV